MELIVISKSVGRNGQNLAIDVAKIAAALVAVGPERGGIFAPPLGIEGLAQAIKLFQDFHKLPARDGRVDPAGNTLKKINGVLFPGLVPVPPTPPQGTGALKVIDATARGLATSVNRPVNTPLETSLIKDLLLTGRWSQAAEALLTSSSMKPWCPDGLACSCPPARPGSVTYTFSFIQRRGKPVLMTVSTTISMPSRQSGTTLPTKWPRSFVQPARGGSW